MSPPAHKTLHLQLLGAPRLLHDGAELHVLERRDAALLALLALEGTTLRSRAAALLWPDLSDKAARSNLRQRLFRLRRVVGEAMGPTTGDDWLLTGDTLSISPAASVDVISAPHVLSTEPEACPGDLLGSHDYSDNDTLNEWVRSARERWRQTRLELLATQASKREAASQIVGALRYAQRIVADNPLHEHTQRQLMRLHYLRGDRSAALAGFEALRARLALELGVEPDRETRALASLIDSSAGLPRTAAPPRPVTSLRPPRIVGQSSAWSALALACDTQRSALVEGEPGAGKTRLLSDFAASRGQGTALFAARPGDSQLPYALLAQVVSELAHLHGPPAAWAATELARIAPCLGPAPTGRLDHLRFRQALDDALNTWQSRGLALLVLDDLHYADDATLDLLPALLRPAGGHTPALACMLAVRSLEIPHALQDCLASLDERSLVRIRLDALDTPAVQELVESLGIAGLDATHWAPVLSAHAGGNPLFVIETLMSLLQQQGPSAWADPAQRLPVPATVRQLITRRLQRLSAPAQLLAQLAATAGQDMSPELATNVLKRPALEVAVLWDELESAQVLRGNRFAHDLIQAATASATPATVARLLHRDIAQHLAGTGDDPARLAHHWQQAGHWSKAGASYLEAAAVAESASQRRLEAQLAAEAAACFLSATDREREFLARERQVRAALYVEPFEQQVQHAQALIALAATPMQRCTALEAYARILVTDIQDDKVIAAAGEARRLAAGLGDTALELLAASLEARALARANRVAEATALFDRYLPLLHTRGREEATSRAMADFGCALMTCDRVDQAEALFSSALSMATQLEDWSQCQELFGHAAWVHQYRGDVLSTARAYESARDLAPRLGAHQRPADLTECIRARCYLELGRYTEALALLESTLAVQRQSPSYSVVAVTEALLCKLHLWLGQPARAAASLTVPAAGATPLVHRQYLVAKALIAMQQGQSALHWLAEALRMAQQEGGLGYALAVQALQVRLLPPDEGIALALRGCAQAEAVVQHMALWPLKMVACEALHRAGQVQQAATLARELSQRLARFAPFAFYGPEYGLIISQALRAAGDETGADQTLHHTANWIREVALPQVPPEFRASFLDRNPVNRRVLLAVPTRGTGLATGR